MEFQVGDIIVGEVTGLQPYGAFIRFPNDETGLIHISEISSFFVKNITDYVHINQHVRVKIIDILEDRNLYRLSLKQVAERRRQNIRKINYQSDRKKKVLISHHDFSKLQESLPKWIEKEISIINEEEKHD